MKKIDSGTCAKGARSFKIAVCQQKVRRTKSENIAAALEAVGKSAESGAGLVVLPEMFVCDFVPEIMKANAEPAEGETVSALKAAARDNNIWLAGGSFPELAEDGRLYNTCPIISPEGSVEAFYRKIHLFDVDIKDGVTSTESDVFTPGNRLATADMGFARLGAALCYDVRFPYVFTGLARLGSELAVLPAAFSANTGAAHWETLIRARALDSQMFIVGACSAYSEEARFKTYGHSVIADPWGRVVAVAGAGEEIITADININEACRVRRELPVLKHMREDLLNGG